MRARDKVLSRRALVQLAEKARARRRRVVFTSGVFDLLHVGHARAFEQARALGDLLLVGVNRDRRVHELKGAGRPVVPERQRAELVASLAAVDAVTLFAEDDPTALIRAVRPHVVCKGGDYRGQRPVEQQLIESLGGEFVLLREHRGLHSTTLLRRMRR